MCKTLRVGHHYTQPSLGPLGMMSIQSSTCHSKAGSDPNIASVEGIALHPAAKEGRLGCVKLLLTAGADANAKDHECRTPLDLAQLELEDERNNREPPGIFFRPRDTEALMKIVELLRPITTEMVAGTDITLERASQSESLPSTPAAHSKSGS